MKIIIILALFGCLLNSAFCQVKDLHLISDSISGEGKAIYKSEFASWYGTDVFSEKCQNRRKRAAGYLSYDNGNGLVNIFFDKSPEPRILSTIIFGYNLNSKMYKLDTADREFTPLEKELFTIRKRAIEQIQVDSIFKIYKNTELNPVPIIQNGIKRVYILTGTNQSGVVLFGNDYLVSFDEHDNIIGTKKLHKGLIVSQISKDETKVQVGGMHSHLAAFSEFITATDICTLMLYKKFTTWNQYTVISKDYVSIWDCNKNQLTITTFDEWQKKDHLKDALGNKSNR